MTRSHSLPIDDVLDDLGWALRTRDAAVLQAPPGAGKTTRVPLALLGEPWLAGKSILMLEPRRLAATNAAGYMARQLGEEVGRTIGYAIRYDRRISAETRVEVVTEGILTRRLQRDPELSGIGLVIFDEFHERNLNSDLALALCRDAQQGLREDLKILVMSATLDAAPVAEMLGGAPVVTSVGRSFPVDIRYLSRDPEGPVAERAAEAVRRALAETEGDVLVFLPGAGEIRRCQTLLEAGRAVEAAVCPLFADLPYREQERAIVPGARRKVVLATNIAETSLTIQGVRVVVDTGFERRPRFDAGRGVNHLETVRISQASAAQRAGRAGREAPGICYRLWSEGIQGALLPFASPEIRTADLAALALELARWGVADPSQLVWLDPPPAGSLAAARRLLRELGALDARDRLTPLGEEVAGLPAHPRLARLLVAGKKSGDLALACELAALLAERDILRRARHGRHAVDSDLEERLEVLQRWRAGNNLPAGADAGACAAVGRAARHFRRLLRASGPSPEKASAERFARLLAPAYPDRIAGEREPGSGRYVLLGGQGARLAPQTAVRRARFLVALEMAGSDRGEGQVRLASALSRELVEELFAGRLTSEREVCWDAQQKRVRAREVRRLGALELAVRPAVAEPSERQAALLEGVRSLGLEVLDWSPAAVQLVARIRFLAGLFPDQDWPDVSTAGLLNSLDLWLGPFLGSASTAGDLQRIELAPALRSILDWSQQKRLDELAPERLPVPGGSRIRLDYTGAEGPILAVKLQELFGLADTPRVAGGRVAVVLHLLSPARRPLQVTRDLKNFWDNVYPEVRREFRGRYPKHPWPEDPWSAAPTGRTKRRT